MEASVIQQDVGVTLYVENAPEPSPTPDASASPLPDAVQKREGG